VFEASNPVKGRHKRQAQEFAASTKAFVAQTDGSDIGCLTITSAKKVSWEEEKTKLNRINRLLHRVFPGGWARFAEFTEDGVTHHHLIGRAAVDLAKDYDLASYERMKGLNDRALNSQEKVELSALRKRRFGNGNLEALTTELRTKLPGFGFGVVTELAPIRKNAEAIAGYAIEGYYYSLRHAHDRPKGGRLYSFSRNFPRIKLPPSESQLLCRRQMAFAREAMGGAEAMTARYGSKWRYLLLTYALDELISFPGPSDPLYWDPACVKRVVELMLEPYEKKPIFRDRRSAHEAEVLSQLAPLPGFTSY